MAARARVTYVARCSWRARTLFERVRIRIAGKKKKKQRRKGDVPLPAVSQSPGTAAVVAAFRGVLLVKLRTVTARRTGGRP